MKGKTGWIPPQTADAFMFFVRLAEHTHMNVQDLCMAYPDHATMNHFVNSQN